MVPFRARRVVRAAHPRRTSAPPLSASDLPHACAHTPARSCTRRCSQEGQHLGGGKNKRLPSLTPSPSLSLAHHPPRPLSPAAALDSFRDRAKAANEATSKAALDLAPDRPLPKAIATLEAKLACAAAAIAEREGALEAITRVCRTAKARLEEADTRVSSLRARCEALDAAFVQESAALREELAAAVKKAGGAWLGAEAGAGGARPGLLPLHAQTGRGRLCGLAGRAAGALRLPHADGGGGGTGGGRRCVIFF